MVSTLILLLAQVCSITQGIVLIYCVLTWFMPPASRVMRLLGDVIEPMLMPIRRLLMRFTGPFGLDFSPFLLVVILSALRSLLIRLAWML